MPRVDEEVGLLGDDGARDWEDEGGLFRDAGIPERLEGGGAGIRAPVVRKPLRAEPADRIVRKGGGDQDAGSLGRGTAQPGQHLSQRQGRGGSAEATTVRITALKGENGFGPRSRPAVARR